MRGCKVLVVLLAALPCPALACSLCGPELKQKPTFRLEASQENARLILFGTLSNPRPTGNGGLGETDLKIEQILQIDPNLKAELRKKVGDVLTLPRYLPFASKEPPRYLIFCDVFNDRYDPYRAVPAKSERLASYFAEARKLDPKEPRKALAFFFRHLDDADPEIALDAFLEFARARDEDVGTVATTLPPEKLRRWLADPKTGLERLGLYAMLLGACGKEEDARFLRAMLEKPDQRALAAFDGALGGLIHLRPREGWKLAADILGDGKRPLPQRLAAMRTIAFYHGWKPKESKDDILKVLRVTLEQGELADLAVENLRQWGYWELTPVVARLWERKDLDAPIMKRAILRYALTAPTKEAREFVARVRKSDAELVKEVEELIELQKD